MAVGHAAGAVPSVRGRRLRPGAPTMMDRKTMLVLLGCLVAMISWQALVNKLYPPKPKAIKAATAIGATNAAPTAVTDNATEKPGEPVKDSAVAPEEPGSPEQTVTLSNEFVRMEFTTWGGGVRSVELLKQKVNGAGNVVLNGTNFVPALTLMGITNGGPDAVFTVEQPTPNTVVMKRQTRLGLGITKTFSLNDGYLLTGAVEIARVARGSVSLPDSVDLAIGTAAPTTVKELPTYLTTGWLGGDKYQY